MNNDKQLSLREQQQPSVADMMHAVIEKGVTKDNVTALEQLVGLYERLEDKRAVRDFNASMVALKQEMPPIQVSKAVPNNDGTIRYKYAPLDEIDAKLRPHALKHGFTYSFSEAAGEPNKVTKVCVVTHIGGDSRSTPFTVRIGHGPPKASEAQSDGAAASYAQRRALCDAFGIIVESDTDGADDARNEGHPITQQQADELRELCDETKSDRKKFLEYAGADEFEKISSARFEDLKAMLHRKLRK
jgi:hypothetical protein